jgi:hypothetical protein
MNSDEQLTFALAQAEFWRLKYLKAVEEEREACAKVCDDEAKSLEDKGLPTMAYGARYSATAIRARGEKP